MTTGQVDTIRKANQAIRGITSILQQDQIMANLLPDYWPHSEQDREDLLIGVEVLSELIEREIKP